MELQKLKSAVIGAGYLGRFHAEKYATAGGLVAVVDVKLERAEELASRLGVKALTDYRLLPGLGVQCVSVASDTGTHFEIAKWLLENGIDVLVEKPMTVTIAQAEELIAIAANTKRILQVGHLERFNPAFRRITQLLTKPFFFEARRIAPFTGRGADVDVVRDLMIHDIDIISSLVGRPLKRLDAVGVPVLTNSFDIASARLLFEGGCIANVTTSRAAFKSERTIRIFQPDVYISLDYGSKRVKLVHRLADKDPQGMPRIETEEHVVEEGDALNDEIIAFLSCVETRSAPLVGGEDGLRALQLVERIHKAIVEGLSEYDPGLIPPEITQMLTGSL